MATIKTGAGKDLIQKTFSLPDLSVFPGLVVTVTLNSVTLKKSVEGSKAEITVKLPKQIGEYSTSSVTPLEVGYVRIVLAHALKALYPHNISLEGESEEDVKAAFAYVNPKPVKAAKPEPAPTPKAKATSTPPPAPAVQTVKLRDATEMYQAVDGSSAGSVYRVVAISKDDKYKVAARVIGIKVSIRVEWSSSVSNNDAASILKDSGLVGSGSYWSGHFNATKTKPRRVIVAFLSNIGLEWKTPFPTFGQHAELQG